MSAWILRLALLAACLRFGCAEGDPLPPALVELVRNSPIASIQDLQLLLLTDSVEEDPARGLHSNTTFNRLPRSLDAQPAQQALCKVRTEVLEVTRAMLDRRNANFMLWPPCVEVQRCSGCCNARTLQCVPIITHTRYLQVMKIQYVNKRPHYDKAVISVQDHVECRCQSAPLPKAPRTTPKKVQPRRQSPKDPQAKARSKEELHRRDELKRNQKFQLDERDMQGQQWQPIYSQVQTIATQADMSPRRDNALPGHFHAQALQPQAGPTLLQVPSRAHNRTRHREEEEMALLRGLGLHRHYQDMVESGLHESGLNGTEQPPWQILMENATQVRRHGSRHDRTDQRVAEGGRASNRSFTMETWDPEARMRNVHADSPLLQQGNASRQLTELRHPHKHDQMENNQTQHNQTQPWDKQPLEMEERQLRLLQQEQLNLEVERQELLLLHQKLDQEKQRLKQQQQHHHHHQLHNRKQTHTTTQRAVTVVPSTMRPPPVPPTIQAPARHAPPKRRMRKNRNRISKAAMRAMLM
ncbi:hypothetical protein AAFF_G00310490 [Aldrovandia affinis]|uniref:Platelet-derived growth factor subunit B n=1 Tax=Aldrovandia affinis TaxID=143900 RepID=A0AAD7W0U6_9TELE|nr:hypothetical protein AAFF_G00310490 [Aldrovandia affinis]